VTVAGADLLVGGPPDLAVGADCRLLVRPESLALAEADTVGLPVRLETQIYVGAFQRCEVVTADGQRLVFQVPVRRQLAPNDALVLAIDPDQAWLMKSAP
jgi:multiple sugar transport system ATP-binding protein/lactose/L-arabinose transport system ATP-binding protein